MHISPRSCWLRWPRVAAGITLLGAVLLGGAPRSDAHQSPAGCTGNALLLAISRDSTLTYTDGSTIAYSVTVAIPAAVGAWQPCQVTNIQAVFTRPDGGVVVLTTIAALDPGQSVDFTGDAIEGLNYTVGLQGKGSTAITTVVAAVTATGLAQTGPQDGAVEAHHTLSTDIVRTIASLLGAGPRGASITAEPALRVRMVSALPFAERTVDRSVAFVAGTGVVQPLNLNRWIGGPLPDRRDWGRG